MMFYIQGENFVTFCIGALLGGILVCWAIHLFIVITPREACAADHNVYACEVQWVPVLPEGED